MIIVNLFAAAIFFTLIFLWRSHAICRCVYLYYVCYFYLLYSNYFVLCISLYCIMHFDITLKSFQFCFGYWRFVKNFIVILYHTLHPPCVHSFLLSMLYTEECILSDIILSFCSIVYCVAIRYDQACFQDVNSFNS